MTRVDLCRDRAPRPQRSHHHHWLSAFLLLLTLAAVSAFAPGIARASGKVDQPPATIIVLADEASLLTDSQLTAEKAAIRAVAAAEPAAESTMTVLGYGSATAGPEGPPPTDVLCPPVPIGPRAEPVRQILVSCADRLTLRAPNPDETSDLAAALDFVLTSPDTAAPPSQRRIILLLSGSPATTSTAYGPRTPPLLRAAQAREALTNRLPVLLRTTNTEIWPVGFGQADMYPLVQLATGSAQPPQTCPSGATSPPTARFAERDAAISTLLLGALRAARCDPEPPEPASDLVRGKSADSGTDVVSLVLFLWVVVPLAAVVIALAALAIASKVRSGRFDRPYAAWRRDHRPLPVTGMRIYLFEGKTRVARHIVRESAQMEVRLRIITDATNGHLPDHFALMSAASDDDWHLAIRRAGGQTAQIQLRNADGWINLTIGGSSTCPVGVRDLRNLHISVKDRAPVPSSVSTVPERSPT